MTGLRTFVFGALLVACALCCDLRDEYAAKRLSLEDSTAAADVVLRGLVLGASWTPSPIAHVQLLNTYKGAAALMATGASVYKQVNVTLNGDGSVPAGHCLPGQEFVPAEYIVFCTVDEKDTVHAEALARWTEPREKRVWTALGWGEWSDWSSCSVSCSGGIQQRTRKCKTENATCPGYNVEQRHCNLFSCYGTVDPLSVDERAYFHGPRGRWQRVPDRPTAWKLHPDSYIWVPSSQLFQRQTFPHEFALFVTLRLAEQTRLGTVFSLRSRRRQDAYVSLELAGREGVNLVHASANGTDIVRIPIQMDDNRWHHIAISVRDGTTIHSYIDCEWLQTDILKENSFDIPEDSDLIIGYLFEGDLEQMTILADPEEVPLQCSPSRTPIMDASLEDSSGLVRES